MWLWLSQAVEGVSQHWQPTFASDPIFSHLWLIAHQAIY